MPDQDVEEFVPPPAGETVPPPGPSDRGAPDLPDPPDDGVEYVDPLAHEEGDRRKLTAAATAPTGSQVLAYARTFKGVADGRRRENENDFTHWYYGNSTAASFCLIFICYVFNHFDVLVTFLGGKIAYCPDVKKRVGSKFHTTRSDIRPGDPVLFDFNNTNEPEHVGLFVKWLNDSHTMFESFEANTTGGGSSDWIGAKTRYWSDVFGYVKPGLAPENPNAYPGKIYRYVKGDLMHDDHIEWAQGRLNAKGASPKLVADGVYGTKTRDEVSDFQSANGLTKDGEIGPKTWAKLGA